MTTVVFNELINQPVINDMTPPGFSAAKEQT